MRGTASSNPGVLASEHQGSRNRNKDDIVLTDVLKQLQTMVTALLQRVGHSISLRFQIEFNFRDAKRYWGLQDFMNVNKIPVNNAANLSMFMVNVSAKLIDTLRCKNTTYSVLDLRAHYRGLKYLHETLKILPQKHEPIVIQQIAQHLGAIGAIHHTQPELNPG
ncbi:MAG: hypothetical protein OXM61_06690 [Candidatus Poribacteria bacterium]|nr:hypothetical protein [Candidatus Poribacteria bacterium]